MRSFILLLVSFIFNYNLFSQCACCSGAGLGSSSGDVKNSTLNVTKNHFILEAYEEYRNIKDIGIPEEADETLLRKMFITSFGVRYGVSKKFTLSALIPYVFLKTNRGNDNGFGDLALVGNYKLYASGNSFVTIQAGIELPTGTQKASSFDNTTIAVGSGSYDPMIGIGLGKQWKRFGVHLNGIYKFTSDGFEGNYYGDVTSHNLTFNYNLKGESAICKPADSINSAKSKKPAINLFTGYSGEWVDRITENKEVEENSGYYAGFFNAGINLNIGSYSIPVTASFPIITNMNGLQNPPSNRLRIGLIKYL